MKMSAVVKLSDRALADNVDKLGALNADLAALNKKIREIKDKLIASGYGEIEGKSYRAVISIKESVRLDPKVVRSLLSPAEVAMASKVSESVSVSLYDL
jgi:hypothetical protein